MAQQTSNKSSKRQTSRSTSNRSRTAASRSGAGSRASSRNGSSHGGGAKPRTRSQGTSRSRAQSSRQSASNSPVASARDAITHGAQSTGGAIGEVAGKAKGPAMAGGAALAGLLGGVALATRGGRKRVLGVPVPGTRRSLINVKTPRRNHVVKDVAKAAGQMGKAGGQMAELASEVRLARQQMDSGRRRSPIEVVLEGLTSRRNRAG
jgi:hypothetical protein